MTEVIRILGIIMICMISGLLYFFCKRIYYYEKNALYKDSNVKQAITGIMFCVSIITSIIVAIALPSLVSEKRSDSVIFVAGIIVGLVVGAVWLKILDLRDDMNEFHILSKIEILENNLEKIKKSKEKTEEQVEAQKIIEETIKTLKIQINNLRIKDSIKVGKEILYRHKEIDITKELYELEALQELSKV